jgi:hypothetical protein
VSTLPVLASGASAFHDRDKMIKQRRMEPSPLRDDERWFLYMPKGETFMAEADDQRWKQYVDLARQYMQERDEARANLEKANETTRMLQECLVAMVETTGRAAIRVEYRINKETDAMYVVASTASGMLDHLAKLVGASLAAFQQSCAKEEPVDG